MERHRKQKQEKGVIRVRGGVWGAGYARSEKEKDGKSKGRV